MTKPVTLSDSAFAALRKEKKEGESDSDVVQRLIKEARGQKKDPWEFVRRSKHLKKTMTAAEHMKWVKDGREASARDKWAEAKVRNAKGAKPRGRA